MNGSFYQNPSFPINNDDVSYQMQVSPPGNISSMSNNDEQSYIENILRMNKGKRVNAYVSFGDSSEWQNKVFEGIIEAAGKDHLIMSNPETNKRYLIKLIYLNYVEFMESINYNYPYETNY